ncbi:hypothetical protein BGZ73_008318 [Actinomortierella ambigua]|nr:hypothetical protein BGZ73_008318 [Actinomortierella ambigua]
MTGRSACSARTMATKSSNGMTRSNQGARSANGGRHGSRSSRLEPTVDLGSWGLAPKNATTSQSPSASSPTLPTSVSPELAPSLPIGVANLRYLIYSTAAEHKLDARRFPTWLRQQAQQVQQQQLHQRHHIPSAIVPPLSALQQLWRVVFAPTTTTTTSVVERVGENMAASSAFSLSSQQNLEALTSADWGLWILWLWHHGDWATLAQMHATALERPLETMAAKIPDEAWVLLTEARIRHGRTLQQQQQQQQQQQILQLEEHEEAGLSKTGRSRGGRGAASAAALATKQTGHLSSTSTTTEAMETTVQWIHETAACLEGLGRQPLVELYELWTQEAYDARDWQQVIEGAKEMERMQPRLARRPKIHVQVELSLACLGTGDVQAALLSTERALVDASLLSSSSSSSSSAATAAPQTLGKLSSRRNGRAHVAVSLNKPSDRWRSALAGLREQVETASTLAMERGEGEDASVTAKALPSMTKTSLYPLLLDALSSGEQDPRAAQRATEVFRDWLGQLQPSSRSSGSSSVSWASTMDPSLFHKLVRFIGLSAGSVEAEALVGLLSSSLDAMRGGSKLSDTAGGFEIGSSSSSSSSSGPSTKTVVKKDRKHQLHAASPSASSNSQQSGIDAQVAALRTLANIGCQEVLIQALREGDMHAAKRMFQVLGSPALQLSSMLPAWTSGGSSNRHGAHSSAVSRDSNHHSGNGGDLDSSSSLSQWLAPVQNGLYDMYLEVLIAEADFGMALTVLQKMLVHDRVPATESLQRLIGGMVKADQLVEAMGVYRELTEVFGVKPTPGLLQNMLGLAAKYGDLSLARKIRRMLVGMDKAVQNLPEPSDAASSTTAGSGTTASSSMLLTLSPSASNHQQHALSSPATTKQQQEASSAQSASKVDLSRMYHDLMVCYTNHMNIPGAFRIFESMGLARVPYEIRHINALLVGTMAKGRVPLPDTTVGILEVMATLKLQPNAQTYRALLKAALLNRDRPLAERWFRELATEMLSGNETKKGRSLGSSSSGSDYHQKAAKWSSATGAFDHWRVARHGETFELLMGEYVRMYGVRPAVRLLEGVMEAEFCVPRPDVFRMLMARSCDEGDGRTGHRVFELMKQQQQTATNGAGASVQARSYLTSQPADLALYHRLLEQVVEREQDIDRGQAIVAELIVSGVVLDTTLVEDAIAVYAHRLETARAALGIYSRMKRVYGIRNPTPKMLASLDQLARKTAAAADAAAAAAAAATVSTPNLVVDQLSSSATA